MSVTDHIIARFGSMAALAKALGHKHPTTVQGWKDRGVIPARRQQEVLEAARRNGIALSPADFFQNNPRDEAAA